MTSVHCEDSTVATEVGGVPIVDSCAVLSGVAGKPRNTAGMNIDVARIIIVAEKVQIKRKTCTASKPAPMIAVHGSSHQMRYSVHDRDDGMSAVHATNKVR